MYAYYIYIKYTHIYVDEHISVFSTFMYIFKMVDRVLLRPCKLQIKLSTYTKAHDTCRNVLYIMQRKGSHKCFVRLNKDAVLAAWPAIHMLKRHSDRYAQTMTNPGVSADPIEDRDWIVDRDFIFFSLHRSAHLLGTVSRLHKKLNFWSGDTRAFSHHF